MLAGWERKRSEVRRRRREDEGRPWDHGRRWIWDACVPIPRWFLRRRISLLSQRRRRVERDDSEGLHLTEERSVGRERESVVTVHQIENEAKFVVGVKGISHTDDERATLFLEEERESEWEREGGGWEHTPVLTSESMIRSFNANVSPCFILILFLSRHFMAYLKERHTEDLLLRVSPSLVHLHFARIRLSTSVDFSESSSSDDSVHTEVVHG
jgi:hypothetical protein